MQDFKQQGSFFRSPKSLGCFCVGLLPPLALLIYWHVVNLAFPKYDCVDYSRHPLHSFFTFQHEGLWAGLHEMYFVSAKPTFLTALLVSGLLLSGGQLLFSIALVQITSFIIFLGAIFQIIKKYVGNIGAAAGVLLIGSLSTIFNNAVLASTEGPFFAGLFVALYYSLNPLLFRKGSAWFCFSVSVAVAISVRPLESVMVLLAPLLVHLWRGLKAKDVQVIDLILLGSAVVPFVFVIRRFLQALPLTPPSWYFWFGLELLPIVLGWLAQIPVLRLKKEFLPSIQFLKIVTIAYGLMALWYAPKMESLASWLQLGARKEPAAPQNLGFFKFALLLFSNVGGFSLVVLLGFLLIRFLRSGKVLGDRDLDWPRWQISFSLFGAILTPLLAGFIAGKPPADLRYFQASGVLVVLTAWILVLKTSSFQRLVWSLAGAVAVFQFWLLINFVFALSYQPRWPQFLQPYLAAYPTWYSLTPTPFPDPEAQLFQALKALLENGKPIYISYLPLYQPNNEYVPNLHGFVLQSLARGEQWYIEKIYDDNMTPEARFAQLRQSSSYLIIGPLDGVARENLAPLSPLTKKIAQSQPEELEKRGLSFYESFEYADRNHPNPNSHQVFNVYRILK